MLGYSNSTTDTKVDIDELKDALPKHSIFYILTHGVADDPRATNGQYGFMGFKAWNNDLFWDNYDVVVQPPTISANLGSNEYTLVFINGCASADNSSGGATAFADAFKTKNYVGWKDPVTLTSAAPAAEQFFAQLDHGTTVRDAVRGVQAVKGSIGFVLGAPATITKVSLDPFRVDDSVIIDNTP